MGASRLEETSLFQRMGTELLSERSPLTSSRRVKFGDGLKQDLSVGMEWPAEEIFSIGHFHHPSQIHDGNSITDMFDDTKVMGDEEIGEAQLIPQVHQEV
jgi:hypothetical protein